MRCLLDSGESVKTLDKKKFCQKYFRQKYPQKIIIENHFLNKSHCTLSAFLPLGHGVPAYPVFTTIMGSGDMF